MRQQLREWLRFVRSETHVLRINPGLLAQLAANQPVSSPPEVAARRWEAAGRMRRPWMRWVNKPKATSPCLLTLAGHAGMMTSCSYSPDGSRIVSGNWDKLIRIWDARTGEQLAALHGHTEGVTDIVYSPDGSRIASASEDKTLRLWDAETAVEIRAFRGHDGEVTACCFSRDGARLASASSDRTVKVWDVATGAELRTLRGHSDLVFGGEHVTPVTDCAFAPDGTRVLSASADSTLKLWDSRTGIELLSCSNDSAVGSCAFSPDGARIVSGDYRGRVKAWDAASGAELGTLEGHTERVNACAFAPDGSRVASASADGAIIVWDVATRNALTILRGHTSGVACCEFSPDGRLLVSASDDDTLKIWDPEPAESPDQVPGFREGVSECAFSPDGCLIVAQAANTLRISDGVTGIVTLSLRGHTGWVTDCAFSPEGSRLVSGSGDGTLMLWDPLDGHPMTVLRGHSDWVHACRFSPDGLRIASASADRTLRIWDGSTGAELTRLLGHTDSVWDCAFSPDGARLVSACCDGSLKVWDLRTGVEFATLRRNVERGYKCSFSPDGAQILSIFDGQLVLWDAWTGAELVAFPMRIPAPVFQACSPDGTWFLATPTDDHLLRIGAPTGDEGYLEVRDANTCAPRGLLRGHSDEIVAYAPSPDARRVASASRDGTVKVWDVESATVISEFAGAGLGRSASSVAWSPRGDRLAVGSEQGIVYLLIMENLEIGPLPTTATRWFRFDRGKWDRAPTARCGACGQRFATPKTILDVIRSICRAAKVSKADSPCAKLPAEAWQEPQLLSSCPHCRQAVKFNPFVVDGPQQWRRSMTSHILRRWLRR